MPDVVGIGHDWTVELAAVVALDFELHLARAPRLLALQRRRLVRRDIAVPREVAVLLVAHRQPRQQLKDRQAAVCVTSLRRDVITS